MFSGFLSESIVARAVKKGLCEVNVVDLREFGLGKWKKTDDAPYGGGPGMLMRCEPWFAAVEKCLSPSPVSCPGDEDLERTRDVRRETRAGEDARQETGDASEGRETRDLSRVRIIMTSPAGKTFTQRDAEMFAQLATSNLQLATTNLQPSTSSLHLIFMCGHYEGFDARIETLATDKYSIGDFVMTGGELAAAAMADAIVRLLPGALGGGPAATASESFGSGGMLEAPQYTHPPEFRGMKVPEVLLSGDHRKIEAWKLAEARKLTEARRPDLLANKELRPC